MKQERGKREKINQTRKNFKEDRNGSKRKNQGTIDERVGAVNKKSKGEYGIEWTRIFSSTMFSLHWIQKVPKERIHIISK